MNYVIDAVYRRIVEYPGTGATDIILGLRSQELDEPSIRSAVWELVADGRIDLDENRNLVPTA